VTSIVVVTSGFPRLSETFALNELLALRERGMLAAVFATKPGTWSSVQPQVESLRDLVHVLPPGSVQEQAAVAAAAARRLGVPHGFSAHALDIRKVPAPEMAERAGTARTVVTCNSESARQLRVAGAEPLLVPHGVDVVRFSPAGTGDARAAGASDVLPRTGPARVLGVGRLVEKKGFDVLVDAVARLHPGRAVLRVVGTGPQEPALRALVDAHGLGDVVQLVGARTHDELPGQYRAADVVVVPSVVDAAGDQDGLPNVVLEAMACGAAVVASDVAAVGDAVEHGRTGLLVPPGDPGALAAALTTLADDDGLRRRLGDAARAEILRRYDLATCTRHLCDHLEAMYA
jgi:glycosyltransferase involved in cell wall biosynthesis